MEPFIVEEIVEDRCPHSLMTDTQTYAQHYENQYYCKIIDLNQPLLRISNAEKHHFMYAPLRKESESTRHKEQSRDKFLSKRTLLGTIHILSKHFYSTKFKLISKFFAKTVFFSSNQKNFFFHHYILTKLSCCSMIFFKQGEKCSKKS